jgi:hypothetical protein
METSGAAGKEMGARDVASRALGVFFSYIYNIIVNIAYKIPMIVFIDPNIVRTLTEHSEPELNVQVFVHLLLEPNPGCRFRFRPKTPEPEPNRTPASLPAR